MEGCQRSYLVSQGAPKMTILICSFLSITLNPRQPKGHQHRRKQGKRVAKQKGGRWAKPFNILAELRSAKQEANRRTIRLPFAVAMH